MPATLTLNTPLTADEKASALAFLGGAPVSGGGTGTTPPPTTDYFPADPGLAPFPSPENSQILNTNAVISGRPYLKDKDGAVHRLILINGIVKYDKGGAQADQTDDLVISQLLVRQGNVYAQMNGIWRFWGPDGTVRSTSLPDPSTGPVGGPPAPTPDPVPATILPGTNGRIIKAGPTQTLKTLSDAIPTAVAGDTIQLDPGAYTDTPPSWGVPLLIDLGGATFDATGKTATLARGKALLCPGADSIIQNGTITGVALDQTSGQLTSAIRPDDGCGYLTVKNMKLHGNQCGIGHGGFPIVILVEDSDISGNGLLPGTNTGSLTHNLYVQGNRLTLTNVVSTAPNEAHAIKSRALELIINGGTFASDIGSCLDIPDGTAKPFAITGATFQKGAGAIDHHLMGYGEESGANGMTGGTITGGSIAALCPNPFITGGGTITASGVTVTGNAIEATGGIVLKGFP